MIRYYGLLPEKRLPRVIPDKIHLERVFVQTHYEGIVVDVQNTMLNHCWLCKADLSDDIMNSLCVFFDVFPVYLKAFNIMFISFVSFYADIDLGGMADSIFCCWLMGSCNKDGLGSLE